MQSHQPRKRFGQHFLIDQHALKRMVQVMLLQPSDHLIEIGPGMGALTTYLLDRVQSLTVIELDRDLAQILNARWGNLSQFHLVESDVLKVDLSDIVDSTVPIRVCGNLPYQISTPLLFHLLNSSIQIQDMHFLLQKEVVERMSAKPGSAHYGRLSVMCQYAAQVEPLFQVKPRAFKPPPKVDSQYVRVIPFSPKAVVAQDELLFQEVVRVLFTKRRKMIQKSLKEWIPGFQAEELEKIALNGKLRPEVLTVQEFVTLSNLLTERQKN